MSSSEVLVPANMINLNVITLRIWSIKIAEVSVEGFAQGEDDMVLKKVCSNRVVKRLTANLVLDLEGRMFELSGPIDKQFQLKFGMPLRIVEHFMEGFPEDWANLLAQCHTRRNQRSIEGTSTEASSCNDVSVVEPNSPGPETVENVDETLFFGSNNADFGITPIRCTHSKSNKPRSIQWEETPISTSTPIRETKEDDLFAKPKLPNLKTQNDVAFSPAARRQNSQQVTLTAAPEEKESPMRPVMDHRAALDRIRSMNTTRNTTLNRTGRTTTLPDRTGRTTTLPDRTGRTTTLPDRAGRNTTLLDRAGRNTTLADRTGRNTTLADRTGRNTTLADRTGRNTTLADRTGRSTNALGRSERTTTQTDKPPTRNRTQVPPRLRVDEPGAPQTIKKRNEFVTLSPKRSRDEDSDEEEEKLMRAKREKLDQKIKEKGFEMTLALRKIELDKREKKLKELEKALKRRRNYSDDEDEEEEVENRRRRKRKDDSSDEWENENLRLAMENGDISMTQEPEVTRKRRKYREKGQPAVRSSPRIAKLSKLNPRIAPRKPMKKSPSPPKPPTRLIWNKRDVNKLKRILAKKKPSNEEDWRIVMDLLAKQHVTVEDVKKYSITRLKYKPPVQTLTSEAVEEEEEEEEIVVRRNGIIAKSKAEMELRGQMNSRKPRNFLPEAQEDVELNAGDISADNSILAGLDSPRVEEVQRQKGGTRRSFVAVPFEESAESIGVPSSPLVTEEQRKEQATNARYVQHLMNSTATSFSRAGTWNRTLTSRSTTKTNISLVEAQKKAQKCVRKRVILDDNVTDESNLSFVEEDEENMVSV